MDTIYSTASRSVRVAPRIETEHDLPEQVVTLANDVYRVELSGLGNGWSACGETAINRCLPQNRGSDGFHFYLRDLDDGFVWSAAYQPTRVLPSLYAFRSEGRLAEIRRVDREIECRLLVCVCSQHEMEIRCCELTNLGDGPRRIEITSYLEWVLGNRAADAGHPCFSKLFVETHLCDGRRGIVARRRPRQADEREFWGFHAIVLDGAVDAANEIQWETNRARFIGRGNTLRWPQALRPNQSLSGEYGPVLDPIASLRTVVAIDAGRSQCITFVLGGAPGRTRVDELLELSDSTSFVEKEIDRCRQFDGSDGRKSIALAGDRRVIVHAPHRPGDRDFTSDGVEREFAGNEVRYGNVPSDDGKTEQLQFNNGYGGFAANGREYVIRLRPDGEGGLVRPPSPWVNVIANEEAGFLVSESGAGYSWAGNSRENRLTTWHNDPVCDPHSEAIWVRDEESGNFWSPTPGPSPARAAYEARHGFGYTTFAHASQQLSQEVTMFVPRHHPVKLTRLRLVNRSGRARRLSIVSYVEWALGGNDCWSVTAGRDQNHEIIWARNADRPHYGGRVAFSAICYDPRSPAVSVSWTCARENLVGRTGDLNSPQAVVHGGKLDGRPVERGAACAAWQLAVELPPGGTFECVYLLGETTDQQSAIQLVEQFREPEQVELSLADVKEFWRDTLAAVSVETPAPEIDLMVNGWLAYQNISCRLWGRSAYYQPGGAFGFRDQLQDAAALVYHRPDWTRAQLVCHAAQQFIEGDVLHWWHPDLQCGLRTRFSDDLLWLPFVAAEYVRTTGDRSVLDEEAPFLAAPALANGQQEAYLRPAVSESRASLYEHCCRALDRGLTRGRNGLPLIGCGDWNDGFSRIGTNGAGESVWLGFFIDAILERMLPLCSERGDADRVARYQAYRAELRKSLNEAGWDGAWYRRAYYDNGQPIGSRSSDECRIDALAQAWAVLSGVAPSDRAAAAMDAVATHLVDQEAGIIRLLTPPFDRTPHDPGYIKGYLPGIRENGGQYTHGVLWAVRAMAELGRGSCAVQWLRMLTPVWHTATRERTNVYQTEPYVVAADIYGERPHIGRGGWTWYTGSAGWMLRVAIESILGLTVENGERLVISPCISAAWPQYRLTYRLPGEETRYEVHVANPARRERGVRAARLDGRTLAVDEGRACVPLVHDGRLHRVEIEL